MKIKYYYVFIVIFLILIFSYFIFQALNKTQNSLVKISNANSFLSVNSNEVVSMNSPEASEMSNINKDGTQSPSGNQIGEQDSDAVLFDKAYKAGDRAICDQIKGESSKLLCNVYIINAQAKFDKSPKLCEEIKDDFYRTDCLDNLIIFLAKTEKNKEKCNDLIDKKRIEECGGIK